MVKVLVMQQTPFPNRIEPMHLYQIQEAEFKLGFNKHHYYERATRLNDGSLLYSISDAMRIIEYWNRANYPGKRWFQICQ